MGGTKEKGWGLIRFNNLQVIKGKEDGSAVIQWVNLWKVLWQFTKKVILFGASQHKNSDQVRQLAKSSMKCIKRKLKTIKFPNR